jgi:hypothetical protein
VAHSELYWKTRTPTKNGHIDPLPARKGSMFADTPSSAQRRQDRRLFERHFDRRNVQLGPDVLIVHDRKPWRIVEIRELPPDLWGEDWDAAFADACAYWDRYQHGDRPTKGTWRDRPVMLSMRPEDQPTAEPSHFRSRASRPFDVLPEHYAVCRACGELPPCQHEINENDIAAALNHTEELMAIQPGCCHGCTEPITSRMQAVRFPGPNLWRPDLGDNSAVFHARQDCADAVSRYRRQWEEKGHSEPQPMLPTEDAGDDA